MLDPWRSAILVAAGNRAGNWSKLYDSAIPLVKQRYEEYLEERQIEEGSS